MLFKARSDPKSRRVPVSLIIIGFCGFLLVVYLIIASGARDVGHAMLLIGWWLIPISLFHLVPLVFSALAFRDLLPASSRLTARGVIWIRWIRESINSLLPVASIGGEVAGVRLAQLRGVPGAQAAASIIVDITVGTLSQLVFVLLGVSLLLMHSTERNALVVAWAVLIGIAVLSAAIAGFVISQHRGLFAGSVKLGRWLLPNQWLPALSAGASAIDDAVVAGYRTGRPFLRASLLRLVGWIVGAGEIWLVMRALGQPFGMLDSIILESLSSGVRSAAFMVPGALGALEGSFVLFAELFGLSSETALAIALSKRIRELALGLPGLFVWHWIEGHQLLRRTVPAHADEAAPSDLNLSAQQAAATDRPDTSGSSSSAVADDTPKRWT
jgi:putative membrane protein